MAKGAAAPPSKLLPFTYALPLVLGIGAPTILITRAIFYRYYPDHFVGDSPTISETASYLPSSILFAWCMSAAVLCILVCWALNILRNNWLLDTAPPGLRHKWLLRLLSNLSAVCGIVAALFLLGLSLYNLNNAHDIHMASSWGFYIAQVLAIVLDIVFVLRMRTGRTSLAQHERVVMGRVAVAVCIFFVSLVFLYLYLDKGDFVQPLRYTVQLIYVWTENTLCLLFLSYPWTHYAELRRDLQAMAKIGRKAAMDEAAQGSLA